MKPDEVINLVFENLPRAQTVTDTLNCLMAGRFAWQIKEMGGIEHVQFAYRNNTPIVPPDHCGHPTQLVKRGFIDGVGWPKVNNPSVRERVRIFKWFDGNHYYAELDGKDVVLPNGENKWSTTEYAIEAAEKFDSLTKDQKAG